LNDAKNTLTFEQAREFDSLLIGALSNHISDEDWDGCLKTALGVFAGRPERKRAGA
jgi:hypothetical protein